jgi:hypothetical protein
MKNGFIGRNQVVPVFDDQLLPVFGAIALSSDVLVEEMRVGYNPGIGIDVKCVVRSHPFMTISDTDLVSRKI